MPTSRAGTPRLSDEQRCAIRNEYALRSLRKVADGDYIAARFAGRHDLRYQFLWCAQQAVEKYLKAILVLNDTSAKGLGHDLVKALQRLDNIGDISFNFPDPAREFISYLNEEGTNRYLAFSAAGKAGALLYLDRTVWHIRRYCQWMPRTFDSGDGPTDLLPLEVARLSGYPEEKSYRLRLPSGFLEKVLDDPRSPLRPHLVWKNFYYGRNKKRRIKRFALTTWSENPVHYLYHGAYEELSRLVDFPRAIRRYFEDRTSSGLGEPGT